MKGATVYKGYRFRSRLVSIHAPNEGSDHGEGLDGQIRVWVSIHAPNEGSDPPKKGGEKELKMFQSTLPMKGATKDNAKAAKPSKFQSTLPMKGAT